MGSKRSSSALLGLERHSHITRVLQWSALAASQIRNYVATKLCTTRSALRFHHRRSQRRLHNSLDKKDNRLGFRKKTKRHSVPFLSNVNSRSRSLYAVAHPSVVSVCLSVCLSRCLSVCNARAPYYAVGWNFPQCFYSIWYLCHPLTSTENFTELVLGELLRRGRG